MAPRSEEPSEELGGEEREAAAKDDAADLALGAAFAEHEHEAAEDDGDESEGAGEGSGEGGGEVLGGAFPGGLGGEGEGSCQEQDDKEVGEAGRGERADGVGHVVPPACVPGGTLGCFASGVGGRGD